ncbi:MAG: preprotein translocase subunit SecD [Parcubacteria bacterium C7867-004]|nr:MAG: preprotein translocase subunit SecD [Parcubacteria bacterium C7867-004]
MRFIPALGVLIVAGLLAWFSFSTTTTYPIKLGLDLAGGTELIYRADTSGVTGDAQGALNSLREVIDKRVNLFGVAEPLVQLERSSAVAGAVEDRLLVELPGVTDVKAAVDAIGKTPTLEFKLESKNATAVIENGKTTLKMQYDDTGLTGRYLKKADLQFSGGTAGSVANEPIVVLTFNDEGAKMFEQITRDNVGGTLGIFLDGEAISTPVIREAIAGGTATVSGGFTPEEARELVRNLNFGALPVPIELVGSGTVGATLGADAFEAGLMASIIGFLLVTAFMILWYRLPGLIASVALVIYVLITIAVMKFVPITLTTSGIAGFILSIGMAVDANVLIFERMKEELRSGKGAQESVRAGFGRAWTAIRDGHFTMLISSAILFWIGTSLVQGFALVFGFGVIASLISAVFITRVFLLAVVPQNAGPVWHFLLETGLYRHKKSDNKK